MGIAENRQDDPPSPPPTKMRKPDVPPRVKETDRGEPDHAGRRRSARLSQSSPGAMQLDRPAPVASPSWPDTRTGSGSSPGQARTKTHNPIQHDDESDMRDRSYTVPEGKVTTTMTTRSSSAFKSVFHVRTDTPVDLDRRSGSRSSLRIREQVRDGDEALLRQALRPLRGGLGNVTRERERSWFKPPKVRDEGRSREMGQADFEGKARWQGAGDMMRIEQDEVQDLAAGDHQSGFDFGLPVGRYDLDLVGQAGREDDNLLWDEDRVDVGLMDLDEVDYPEMSCRDYDYQEDENRVIWNHDGADHRVVEYDHEDDRGMMNLE